MARPSTNASVRLNRLEAAIPKVAALKRGEALSAGPMTKLLGVSWPTLREWCDALPGFAESKAFVAGGNGVEYQFHAKRTLDWLLKHFRKSIERQTKASRRLERSVDVEVTDDEPRSLQETKYLIDLGRGIRRDKQEAGELVRREDSLWLYTALNDKVRARIMGNVTKIDPNGNLSAQERARLENWARDTLVDLHGDALEIIGEFDARSRSAGVARRG